MLRRDFTKSNKDYFNKNKIVLICVTVFLLVGIIIGSIFGMNSNFEIKGYHEFSVSVNASQAKEYSKHTEQINVILNKYDANLDTVSIAGEGDNSQFVVRYLNNVKDEQEIEINKLIAEKIGVSVESVTEHNFVKPIVENKDYIYTAVAILLMIVIASIFAYIRYNGASCVAILLGCILGTLGFMSLGTILRLSIGMSYFAMLVMLNMLIIYASINLFETMHKSSWLMSDDYDTAITSALKSSKLRMAIIAISLMIIGLLFVLIAPTTVKYISLNIMFMAVTLLAVIWYVVPFVWSVLITRCRKRIYKVKASVVGDQKENKDN